jgi:hypothetical protein
MQKLIEQQIIEANRAWCKAAGVPEEPVSTYVRVSIEAIAPHVQYADTKPVATIDGDVIEKALASFEDLLNPDYVPYAEAVKAMTEATRVVQQDRDAQWEKVLLAVVGGYGTLHIADAKLIIEFCHGRIDAKPKTPEGRVTGILCEWAGKFGVSSPLGASEIATKIIAELAKESK